MKTHSRLLSTADEIKALADALKGRETIAFDTEFIREQTFFPIVEIIQVATSEESWLVDAKAFKRGFAHGPDGCFDPGIQPLLDVFQDPAVLKIVHAAQGDQECLYTSFKIVASPILDTAVAASLCGYGEGVGLGKLLKSVLGVVIKKGHARTNWAIRPLPEQLLEYALADVEHLVALGQRLLEQLDELGRRTWGLELSAKWSDPSLYEMDTQGLATRLSRGAHLDKRAHSALVELVGWREERVRQLNVPRRWVADDAVLMDLARVRPKDIEHLSTFRGLNKGELKHSGELILSALKRASESADSGFRDSTRPDIPSSSESQVLDLLRCYLGILADQHKIALKHLTTVTQLLPLLRAPLDKPEDLIKAGVLNEHAAKLVGDELLQFVKGNRALSISNREVSVVELKGSG